MTERNIQENRNIANTLNEHNLTEDLWFSPVIREKVKEKRYAQNLYAAMCNMRWQKSEMWPVLKAELWSVTWRSAGEIVADLRNNGETYLDWYCSGIRGAADYEDDIIEGYVEESFVTNEIREDLRKLGWHPVPYDEDDN